MICATMSLMLILTIFQSIFHKEVIVMHMTNKNNPVNGLVDLCYSSRVTADLKHNIDLFLILNILSENSECPY